MMYIGMLWFDNDNKAELKARVQRAADYYQHKYGRQPNLCYVNPIMLAGNDGAPSENGSKGSGVEVKGLKTVLPNHFWIGVSQEGSM
jgi:hypothetical protein